jgi:phospholipase/carboxylesterase
MESVELSLRHVIREPRNAAFKPPVLIMLHSEGGSEEELFGLAPYFDDRLFVVSARAPFSKTSKSHLWFQVERKREGSLINSVEADYSRRAVIRFIEEVVSSYDTDLTQVYLLGVDEGGTIALSIMLTNPTLVAGVIAVSGELPLELRPLNLSPETLRGCLVFVAHGLQDEIVPITSARSMRDYLVTNLVDTTYREYPLGHYVVYESLSDIKKWLSERLDAMTPEAVPTPAVKIQPGKVKVGHVQIKVRDLDRAVSFYQKFLGFKLVERTGNAYAFLASQPSVHHDLALQKVSDAAQTPAVDAIGLAHVAFLVPDVMTFATIYRNLIETKMRVVATDHLISWSMYFTDPDGNGVEIYLDTRDMPGKSHLWQGRDLPLTSEAILEALTQTVK